MRNFFILLFFFLVASPFAHSDDNVRGHVYTSQGKAVEGVLVSDGKQFVKTDNCGCFSMCSDKSDSMVFITVPSGYKACSKDGVSPAFFKRLEMPVDKEESCFFVLEPQDQSNYSVLFMTDVHFSKVKNGGDRKGVEQTLVPALKKLEKQKKKGGKAVISVSLGDFAHDQNWYELGFDEIDAYNYFSKLLGDFPVYGVCGNHDSDAAISGENVDFRSAWQVRRCWGPDRYSMNIGKDHWIFLDDIIYLNEPGTGNLGVGIKGKRNYKCDITDAQLEWMRKDLSFVPDGTRIFLCMHCPAFNTHCPAESIDSARIPVLDKLFERFPKVTIFSGHAHMMHIPECDAKGHFEQYVLPATSGNMWINYQDGRKSLSGDGTPAGIFTADFSGLREPEYDYVTLSGQRQAMTVYDMNEVAKLYANDQNIKTQMQLYAGSLHDYSQPEYANMVFVNYWFHRPGESVHVIENGVELEVTMSMMEDPVYNITRTAYDAVAAGKFKKKLATYRYPHMFVAKAATADAPLLIQVKDAAGKVIREQKVTRPLNVN